MSEKKNIIQMEKVREITFKEFLQAEIDDEIQGIDFETHGLDSYNHVFTRLTSGEVVEVNYDEWTLAVHNMYNELTRKPFTEFISEYHGFGKN